MKSLFLSRKFLVAVINLVAMVILELTGIKLDTEALIEIATIFSAYILGESLIDFKAALPRQSVAYNGFTPSEDIKPSTSESAELSSSKLPTAVVNENTSINEPVNQEVKPIQGSESIGNTIIKVTETDPIVIKH